MRYLVEDPSYLLIALGLAALGCLVALRVTQRGKFLVWAGGFAAVAALVFGFEHYWVTDAERVEAVVYDLAKAVEASDVDRVESHFDDRISFGLDDRTIDGPIPRKLIAANLRRTHFDFVRISNLTTSVGAQTRMGKAEFQATAMGVYDDHAIGNLGTQWSLGFREAAPGVWKVTRITALNIPPQASRAIFQR